jgi:ArsR family transcriptional regulator
LAVSAFPNIPAQAELGRGTLESRGGYGDLTGHHISANYADMFSAMGTEPRLRIMQLLLSAHPDGLVVGEIQEELDIPNSTLSHHLDKLKTEDLVSVSRESTFLRYAANTEALEELLQFLYAECCTRNRAIKPQNIVQLCK